MWTDSVPEVKKIFCKLTAMLLVNVNHSIKDLTDECPKYECYSTNVKRVQSNTVK